jgi:hypothetical protein
MQKLSHNQQIGKQIQKYSRCNASITRNHQLAPSGYIDIKKPANGGFFLMRLGLSVRLELPVHPGLLELLELLVRLAYQAYPA